MCSLPRRLFDTYRERVDAQSDGDAAFVFLDRHGEAERHPFHDALKAAEQTGRELSRHSGPGGVVAVLAQQQRTQVHHVLAALAAGLVPAVLTPPSRKQDPTLSRLTLRSALDGVRPTLVVTDQVTTLEEAFPEGHHPFGVLDTTTGALTSDGPRGAPPRSVPRDAVIAQYSSGTTGIKKGVTVSYDAMTHQLEAYSAALRLRPSRTDGEGDRVVSWLPLYHDMGFVTSLHLCLWAGTTSVLIDTFRWLGDPASYLRAVHEHSATVGWHPNFAYAYMASRVRDAGVEDVDLSSLRLLVNCSEPVTDIAQRAFSQRFSASGLRRGVFAGCYAMAETTFAVTHAVATDVDGLDHAGPVGERGLSGRLPVPTVGRPLAGVALEVRDAQGRPVPEAHTGELWVRAPFLADGYLAAPAATSAAFVGGAYRTGDLGYRVGELFYVVGRIKDTLVVAGVNVFPEDVERVLAEHPRIRSGRVAVFSVFDERTETERAVAVAELSVDVPSTDARPTGAQSGEVLGDEGTAAVPGPGPEAAVPLPDLLLLRQRLLSEVGVSVDVRFVAPGWLVKSSAGKVSRHACRAKWQAEQASG